MISLLPIGDFKALLQRQAFSWPWSRAKIFSPKQYEKASKAILKAFKGGSANLAQELRLNADAETSVLRIFKKRAEQIKEKHPSLDTTRLVKTLDAQRKTGPKKLLDIAKTFKQPKFVETPSRGMQAAWEFDLPWLDRLVKMPVASDPVIAVSELDEVYTQLRSLWYFTEDLSSEFGDALRAVGRKWGVVLDGPSDVTFRMQDGSLWTLQGSQKLFDAMTEGPYLYGSSHRHGDPTKEAIEDAMSDLEGQARKTS